MNPRGFLFLAVSAVSGTQLDRIGFLFRGYSRCAICYINVAWKVCRCKYWRWHLYALLNLFPLIHEGLFFAVFGFFKVRFQLSTVKDDSHLHENYANPCSLHFCGIAVKLQIASSNRALSLSGANFSADPRGPHKERSNTLACAKKVNARNGVAQNWYVIRCPRR